VTTPQSPARADTSPQSLDVGGKDREVLLTISVFARQVGLTPSALRFYDDCGLLLPRFVDPKSGYRYYDSAQQRRAETLRDLRNMDLALVDIRTVLDGAPEEAARVLGAHVDTLVGRIGPARRMAARILAELPWERRRCRVVLSGPELASAARQVVPAAAATTQKPNLACVLLDLAGDEVSVVATDRYRLAVRTVPAYGFSGLPCQLLVPAADMAELARTAARDHHVQLDVDGDEVSMLCADGPHLVPTLVADYPDYRGIINNVGPPLTRAIVDRAWLLDRMVEADSTVVCLNIGANQIRLSQPGDTPPDGEGCDAVCTGPSMRVGFAPRVLGAALATSVGPDVLLEFVDPDRPVVVRSADQGTFTTLAMPVRLESSTGGFVSSR
jgi:DNA polymerase III subunit beta